MASLKQAARIAQAVIPNVWDQVERFRPYCSDQPDLIDRPHAVELTAVGLTASLYPDCPLCRRSIATCPCDPEDSAEALWLQFQAQKGDAHA